MYQHQAQIILKQLACGLDPRSNQVLLGHDILHHPEVIRALYLASDALCQPMIHQGVIQSDKINTIEERQANNIAQGRPKNRSLPWEQQDVDYLLNGYQQGALLKELAEKLGRTIFACITRLRLTGAIDHDTQQILQQQNQQTRNQQSSALITNPFTSQSN